MKIQNKTMTKTSLKTKEIYPGGLKAMIYKG